MNWTPERIQDLRERLGWTQNDLADAMGIKQPRVSDWERGKFAPSPMAQRLLDMIHEKHKEK